MNRWISTSELSWIERIQKKSRRKSSCSGMVSVNGLLGSLEVVSPIPSRVSHSGSWSSHSSSSRAGTNPVIAHHPSAAVQTQDCPSAQEEEEMSLNAKIGVVFLESELPPPLTLVVGLAAGLENPQTSGWQLYPTRPTTARALTEEQLTAGYRPATQRPNTLQLYL